ADGIMFDATLIDATLPLVIVPAAAVGLNGDELPERIDADGPAMRVIDDLRRNAAVRMGLSETRETAPQVVPKVAVVTPPTPTRLLDETTLAAEDADIVVRVISRGQAHRAVPGTAAM
ncbi:acetylornithine aminotransferase, partial [Burkholderia multivorans]